MQLENALQYLGLSEKEARVYLALLELGKGSVIAISGKADIKKPTTYVILDELRKKGLVTLVPRAKKVLYIAESPRKLQIEQREKEEVISEKMPELLAIYNAKEEKPSVKFYQGIKNIAELYKEIIESREVLIYGSVEVIHQELFDQLFEYGLAKVRRNNTKIREICALNKKSIEYAKRVSSENHEVRFISKEFKLPTDNTIFGNKLAIFSYKTQPMAVVIESSDVVQTYKSMFEMVWLSIPSSVLSTRHLLPKGEEDNEENFL